MKFMLSQSLAQVPIKYVSAVWGGGPSRYSMVHPCQYILVQYKTILIEVSLVYPHLIVIVLTNLVSFIS